MRISKVIFRGLSPLFVLCACALPNAIYAQTNPTTPSAPGPVSSVILPPGAIETKVAGETDLYCAGYIQYAPAPIGPEIVGGEQEQEERSYKQGDYVYLNAGAEQGIKVGQDFAIVRPRGQLKSKFSTKKGWLGVYMEELGSLRVVVVKEHTSVATITNSCETIHLGDLLRDVNNRVSPPQREEASLDRFATPTGKQRGHIVLARGGQEMVTRNQVVFIDLGAEDNVKAGDYLTIYRPAGTGNLDGIANEEIARSQDGGFESDRYRGGKYSNQSQRTKDYTNTPGVFFRKQAVTTHEIKRHRPAMPRKVVGEIVILNVQTRTATAIITRVAQEVHTGDFVEVQ